MNILVVCHYGMYEDLGSSFVHSQIREYVRLGHRVRALIPASMGKSVFGRRALPLLQRREADGVELCYVRYPTLSSWGEPGFNHRSAALCAALSGALRGFRPDVIHAHTLGFDSELGARLKRKYGCPLVVTTHGSDSFLPLGAGESGRLRRWCDKADAVVAVSSALREKVRSCGTETPLYTAINGFLPPETDKAEPREGLELLQVCNLLENKRVPTTVRAFALVAEKHPEAHLTLVGDGPERRKIEKLCAELGVSGRVEFTGQLSHGEVLRRMQSADYFVMVSHPEGLGIVYLEAMACGCVVIGTQGEGIADVIRSGENGYLVAPDEPEAAAAVIEQCLAAPEETRALVRRAEQSVRALTWAHNAEQYCKLFGRLADEEASPANMAD